MRGLVFACAVLSPQASASACQPDIVSEGRVAAAIDFRTIRLDDGREVRLAGLAPLAALAPNKDSSTLAALVTGRDVVFRASDETPDRYGRQHAFVHVAGGDRSVQEDLLAQGEAVATHDLADTACATALRTAEADARAQRRGVWAHTPAIKNADKPGDILAQAGQFSVVEGRVISARQAGQTMYLNFGRRWTQDFAVTIAARHLPAFEAAGLVPKSLESRHIRVRGWVEARGGPDGSPRIDASLPAQIELIERAPPARTRQDSAGR